MKEDNRQVAIYQAPSGAIEARLDVSKETIFLTQHQVGELFNAQKAAISKHVKNIFDIGELNKKSTVSILETLQTEGERKVMRKIEYYNLDLILSIGYRVNSANATKFRQWATKTLRQYILDGYVINEKRLLEAKNKFHELQEAVLFLQKTIPKRTVERSRNGNNKFAGGLFKNTFFAGKIRQRKVSRSKRRKNKICFEI